MKNLIKILSKIKILVKFCVKKSIVFYKLIFKLRQDNQQIDLCCILDLNLKIKNFILFMYQAKFFTFLKILIYK